MDYMSLPDVGYVRLPQVLAVIPISKASWWRGIKSGRFPAGHLISPRVRAWSVEEIRSLIAEIGGAE
jgi:predicted DNA-binding transcriptional regulator AlpA